MGGRGTSRLGFGVGGGGRISLMESPKLRDFEDEVDEECDDSLGTRGSQPAVLLSSGDINSPWAAEETNRLHKEASKGNTYTQNAGNRYEYFCCTCI